MRIIPLSCEMRTHVSFSICATHPPHLWLRDSMFARSAQFYDALYHFKDYAAAAGQLHTLVQETCPGATTLLDVACGTGKHLEYLRAYYRVEGLDLNAKVLEIARKRLPGSVIPRRKYGRFQPGPFL